MPGGESCTCSWLSPSFAASEGRVSAENLAQPAALQITLRNLMRSSCQLQKVASPLKIWLRLARLRAPPPPGPSSSSGPSGRCIQLPDDGCSGPAPDASGSAGPPPSSGSPTCCCTCQHEMQAALGNILAWLQMGFLLHGAHDASSSRSPAKNARCRTPGTTAPEALQTPWQSRRLHRVLTCWRGCCCWCCCASCCWIRVLISGCWNALATDSCAGPGCCSTRPERTSDAIRVSRELGTVGAAELKLANVICQDAASRRKRRKQLAASGKQLRDEFH